jgi:hypothetical protein
VSRAHDARRKARRRQEELAAPPPRQSRRRILIPVVCALLVAAFAVPAIRVLDSSGTTVRPEDRTREEVSALFAGIPQHGAAIGNPDAPVTLRIYADLECHTVRRFFLRHLAAIVDTWVRPGRIKIEYRSLQTDTLWEHIFIRQEIAALAAGRQDRFWNFADTFIHDQGKEYTQYATEGFLARVASQVPGMKLAEWRHARNSISVFDEVVLSDHHARKQELTDTPSFLIGPSGGEITTPVGSNRESGPLPVAGTFEPYVEQIESERRAAIPGLRS